MSAEDDAGPAGPAQARTRGLEVDARGASGVQVGTDNFQVNYIYRSGTVTDGIAPAPLVTVSGKVESPYRGLGHYEERDAAFFFGRDSAVTEITRRLGDCLRAPGVLVVSGVSGVGKSSLLRAGVMARLRGSDLDGVVGAHAWPALVITPGQDPLAELAMRAADLLKTDAATLAATLSGDPTQFALTAAQLAHTRNDEQARLVLIVDQFEQVFTRCADPRGRASFVTALHAAATTGQGATEAPAALVVLVVRADFEARCANDFPQLQDAVQHRYLVTPMTELQLRVAISQPPRTIGSDIDPELVALLIEQVHARTTGSGSAGVLPLLSHALDQAWRDHTGDILTLADYERTGGIERAVADSAQRAYDTLTPDQQEVGRRVFLRLIATSAEGTDTADRATRGELAELADPSDVDAVIDAFTNERLLTVAADTVEISHEILLTAWPLLHDTWLEDTRADRRVLTHLRTEAAAWETSGHDPTYLYTGSRLDTATDTLHRVETNPTRYPAVTDTQRRFLTKSLAARQRRTRLRQSLVTLAVVIALALATLTFTTYQANQHANEQATLASAQRLAAVALGMINGDKPGGDERAVQELLATDVISNHATADDLVAAAVKLAWPAKLVSVPDVVDETAAYSPDGRLVATGGSDHLVRVLDADSGEQRAVLSGLTGIVTGVAFSPDSQRVVASGDNGELRLWDVGNQRQIASAAVPHKSIDIARYPVAFSPGGNLIASRGSGNDIQLWDGETLQRDRALTGHTDVVFSVAFSPSPTTHLLASASRDGTVRLWNTDDGSDVVLPGPNAKEESFLDLSFSGDGRTLAAGSNTSAIWLWHQVDRPNPPFKVLIDNNGPHVHMGQNSSVVSVALSDDGQVLFSGGRNGSIRAWFWGDQTAGSIPLQPPRSGDQVQTVAFRPHPSIGLQFLSCNAAGGLRLWNDLRSLIGLGLSSWPVNGVAFSPSGIHVASGLDDGTVNQLELGTNKTIGDPMRATKSVTWITYGSRGARLLASSEDGKIYVWDAATGQPTGAKVIDADKGGVGAVAYSPTEARIVSADADHDLQMWNPDTGTRIGRPLTGHTESPETVAFSPDGQLIASGADDATVRLWDVATGRQLAELDGHTNVVSSVAFSPDGHRLISGSYDGTVRIWDVDARKEIGTLIGHSGRVSVVAYSPKGTYIASGGEDGTVRLWNADSQELVGSPLTGYSYYVQALAFSPDGTELVSAGQDEDAGNVLHLWPFPGDVKTGDLQKTLCSKIPANMSHSQWKEWVGDMPYPSTPPCRDLPVPTD